MRLPEPIQRFHSVPSSTLVEGVTSSHSQERSSPATHFRSAGTTASSTMTTGTTDSRRPNHRRRMSAAEPHLAIARLSHESPIRRNDALQQRDPEPHALRRPLSSRHSLSQPARRHRLAPDTFPHAATRRHCLAARPTATASRCRQASRSLAPLTPTTRCTSKPSTGSPGDDADPLFRPNRRAFTRISSSRNDAFQQHDPKAAARRSRTSPIAVTTALRVARIEPKPSDESTSSRATAV
jgi:hypothetical protein